VSHLLCYTERHYAESCIFNYHADCQYTDRCYAESIVSLSAIMLRVAFPIIVLNVNDCDYAERRIFYCYSEFSYAQCRVLLLF
jgi:hypothetical protein